MSWRATVDERCAIFVAIAPDAAAFCALREKHIHDLRGSNMLHTKLPLTSAEVLSLAPVLDQPNIALSRYDVQPWTLRECGADNRHLFRIPLQSPLLRRAEQRHPVASGEFWEQTAPLAAPGLGRAVEPE